jgi:hypothetical protein
LSVTSTFSAAMISLFSAGNPRLLFIKA